MKKCKKHNWILTQRIPDTGFYKDTQVKGRWTEKCVDYEFVCPDCNEINMFTVRMALIEEKNENKKNKDKSKER